MIQMKWFYSWIFPKYSKW